MKLFVYGTLKRGFRNHHLIEDGTLVDDHAILGGYRMYNVGTFPAIVPDTDDYRVFGEVWEVPDTRSVQLDRLEGVPHMYRREMLYVFENEQIVQRQVYVWNQPIDGMPEVETGFWGVRPL